MGSAWKGFDVLPPGIQTYLVGRWPRPCEDLFSYMAEYHHDALSTIMFTEDVAPAHRAMAIDAAAGVPELRELVRMLVHHPITVIRNASPDHSHS